MNFVVNRTTVIAGPAIVTFQKVSFWVNNSIKVTPRASTFNVKSTALGTIDVRRKDIWFEIDFNPDGRISALLLAVCYGGYSTMLPGQSIFGATDSPLVVQTINNQTTSMTFPCAAISKIPQLMGDPSKTAIGALQFTAIRGSGTAIVVPNSSVTINTNSAYAVPAGTITGATNANPMVLSTGAAHGLNPGDSVLDTGVGGNTNANGTFTVATTPSPTSYTLYQLNTTTPIAGNAAYTGGGTFVRANPGDALNNSDILTSPFASSWATSVPSGFITADSDANPDILTNSATSGGAAAAHGLLLNDRLIISGAVGDTAINGEFFVVDVNSASTFEISATLGGAAIAGAGSYTGGASWTRANVWDSFDSEDGFTLDFQLSTKQRRSSSNGIYDIIFQDLIVTATLKGIGMSESDVIAALNIQGANAGIGVSLAASSQNLSFAGTGINAKVYQAGLVEGPFNYDADNLRIGQLKWQATRSMQNNALLPLFKVSTAAITP